MDNLGPAMADASPTLDVHRVRESTTQNSNRQRSRPAIEERTVVMSYLSYDFLERNYSPTTVLKRASLFEAKASTKDDTHVDRVVLFFADFDAELYSDLLALGGSALRDVQLRAHTIALVRVFVRCVSCFPLLWYTKRRRSGERELFKN